MMKPSTLAHRAAGMAAVMAGALALAGVPDKNAFVAFPVIPLHLHVDLGHQRTGGIEHFQ